LPHRELTEIVRLASPVKRVSNPYSLRA